ncbi:hypothetical protein PVAND_005211 [Polypedilum vanderplanki]|uniref:Uncharacterized protein n=1 Tax=Polypedilum vanderplanki TaxID=319348 RepID=A0A9J6C0G0_POLVA|nr:hypothetical protein PVAND_005211 [Polypedilum vanderplanki]
MPKVQPVFNPDQNLGQLIVKVLEQTPDAITQISDDTNVSVTCGEMRDRILKFAVHLNSLRLKQSDVVGVIAGNTENIAPVVFACFLLGLPINPLAPIMIESDIIQVYSKTKPKLIFCDVNNLKIVQNAVDRMKSEAKIYTVMEKIDGYECVTDILKKIFNFEDLIYPELDPNSVIFIPCSSGSTGPQKGICKTYKELLSLFVPPTIDSHILYQSTGLFWFSGIYFLLYGALFKCLRITTAQSTTAELFFNIIKKYEVTRVSTAPYLIINLLQLDNLEPLESIKMWMIVAARATEDLCLKLKKLCQMIVDDNGNALDNNQQGEIYVKKDYKLTGYYNDMEKFKQVYDGEWFKTGDIGYIDDEGFLYVIDRKKEVLKYNNMQITPVELEEIINQIEGVVSSCAVGVLEEKTGNDIIHAFVIVDNMKNITEDQIQNYVNERVIDNKKLRGGIHFLEKFPTAITGKIDKKKLRSLAIENFTN